MPPTFKIDSDGVLDVQESAELRGARLTSSGTDRNAYEVTVRMSSGGEHGVDLGAADRQSGERR